VIVTFVEILFYIISLSINGGPSNYAFLSPKSSSLDILGAQDNKKILENNQVWRLITPTFLHGDFEHICGNLALQLLIGSGIENGIGPWYMLALYMTSAIGGNLFSGILKPEAIGVGASTAVFGLVGFYLAYVITNYNYMDRKRFGQHWCLLLFVFLLVLLNIGVGLAHNDNHVDSYGHLGGFITGFFAGLAFTELFDYEARFKKRIPDRYTEEEYNACG
jgi:rhomboid protease GluP